MKFEDIRPGDNFTWWRPMTAPVVATEVEGGIQKVLLSPGRKIWLTRAYDGGPNQKLVWTCERPAVPEPPLESIVVDKHDEVWHRESAGDPTDWWSPQRQHNSSWAEINQKYGPLTVLRSGGPA